MLQIQTDTERGGRAGGEERERERSFVDNQEESDRASERERQLHVAAAHPTSSRP